MSDSFASLCTVAHQAFLTMDFPDKNTGVGCRFLLRGSSQPREWTHACQFGRSILNHWATLPANARDVDSISGSGRSPVEGNCNPLQYSCLEIPWTEEPGRLQSTGSQRVGHDWVTKCNSAAKSLSIGILQLMISHAPNRLWKGLLLQNRTLHILWSN